MAARLPQKPDWEKKARRAAAALENTLFTDSHAHLAAIETGLGNVTLAATCAPEIFEEGSDGAWAYIVTSIGQITRLHEHVSHLTEHGGFFAHATGGTGEKYASVEKEQFRIGQMFSDTNQTLIRLAERGAEFPVAMQEHRPENRRVEMRERHALFMVQAQRMERNAQRECKLLKDLKGIYSDAALDNPDAENILARAQGIFGSHRVVLRDMGAKMGAFEFGRPELP